MKSLTVNNCNFPERKIHLWLLFLFFSYVFLVSMFPIWDTDIWWHLRVGEWIVQNHAIPRFDMFSSFDPSREWKTFNGLFEILVYGLQQVAGLLGLRIFFALFITVSFFLWWKYFKVQTKDNAVSFCLIVLLLLVYADRIRIRPHIMNFPFEAMLLLFLQKGSGLKSWESRGWFFLSAVLWSNFHNPCAALGAAVVIGNTILRMIFSSKELPVPARKHMENMWAPILSILGVFCNPYGPSLIFAGIKNASTLSHAVGEGEWMAPLRSFFTASDAFGKIVSLFPWTVLLVVSAVLVQKMLRKNIECFSTEPRMDQSIAPVMFLLISQTAMRFAYLSMPSMSWIFRMCDLKVLKNKIVIVVLTGAAFAGLYSHQILRQGGLHSVVKNLSVNILPHHHPEVAIDLIRSANLKGKIFTPVSWGGYVLWFAHPVGGVSADGRNNMSNKVFDLQNQVMNSLGRNSTQMIQAFEELGSDIVVLPKEAFPFNHWPIEKWIRVAYDPVAEVFIRSDSPDIQNVAKMLNVDASNPVMIQNAATTYFGERYYQSMAEELKSLSSDSKNESIHDWIDIEMMAHHHEKAIKLLVEHLASVPNCLHAATELAQILHDEGKYKNAWMLLEPIRDLPDLPIPTQRLLSHLKQHI